LSGLIAEVDELRKVHPRCGLEKMYFALKPNFIGRDNFIDIFMSLGYRVKKIKNYIRTTIPAHYKYPNLIEGMMVTRPDQVWQTDITYYKVGSEYYYLVFIIDVYTRRIVGYQVSDHMRAEANLKALKMAFKTRGTHLLGLIHHSDRGSQYVDKTYTQTLSGNGIQISMGEKAQDNAFAERVNGTIKNEYLNGWEINNFKELKKAVKRAVEHYNNKRGHKSLGRNISPNIFENNLLNLNDQKRPKVIIYAEGSSKIKEASSLLNFRPEQEPLAHICPIRV